MPGGLTPAQSQALVERYGSTTAAVAIALARADIGDELYALGVRAVPTLDGVTHCSIPNEYAPYIWGRIAKVLLADDEDPAGEHTAGREHVTSRRGPGRHGKDYPGAAVEEVVRQATAAENYGHTLRNRLATEVDGVTRYAVEAIFRLMQAGRLEVDHRAGWLKIDGEFSATPPFVNLRELENRS